MSGDPDRAYFEQIGARVRAIAEEEGDTPLGLLRDGIAGTSADGNLTVWVNALGQVRRVRIEPGTVREGDELRLARAVTEAAHAAAAAAADVAIPPDIRTRTAHDPLPEPQPEPQPADPDPDGGLFSR